jgi:hypothetical protein
MGLIMSGLGKLAVAGRPANGLLAVRAVRDDRRANQRPLAGFIVRIVERCAAGANETAVALGEGQSADGTGQPDHLGGGRTEAGPMKERDTENRAGI